MSNKLDKFIEERKKTILIFGISSFVGSNLAQFLKNDYKIVGTYHNTPVFIPGILTLPCDVLNKDEVQLILFTVRPEHTIYSVGVSSVLDCSRQKELADALNTSGLFNAVEFCQRYKSQICYVSSNYVFGGDDRNYLEMDIPDANTIYGKTQAAAEFYVQKTSLNYLLFRSCNLYGRSYGANKYTLFEKFERNFLTNEPISCDSYIKSGFLDVYYLAMLFRIAFEKKVSNRLLQVCTTDIMSHYEFAKTYAEIFSGSPSSVASGRWSFPTAGAVAPQSEKLSFQLDINNIEGYFHIKMPSIKESLEFTFDRLGGQRVKSSSGSKAKDGDDLVFI